MDQTDTETYVDLLNASILILFALHTPLGAVITIAGYLSCTYGAGLARQWLRHD